MKPDQCCYPNCFVCPYDDCMWENAEKDIMAERKRIRYHQNIEESRKKQRDYRKIKSESYRDKNGLNPNQRKMYQFIVEYVGQHLYPPSIVEIATFVGIALSTAQNNLQRIQKCGLIELGEGQRCIRLVGYEISKKKEIQ